MNQPLEDRPLRHDTAAPAAVPDEAEARRRLHKLAHVLDSAIPLPGGYRIGVDGFLGLVPGIGDITGAALSSYIIAEAHRLGTPKVVLLRMLVNMLVETLVGVIPVVGDLFDFAWKANRRNVALLEQHMDRPREVRRQSAWMIGVILGTLVLLTIAVFALMLALLRWLLAAIG
jgi:hypothetical protein